ncbi:NUDIX hydrolase [Priestia flexa]|uniref:NUDIX hydrolase n=1 Tax=Priestia flexa TaxID=86664 RepID=UPI00099BDD18|nr:NUDIX hydrolase [Priestia flexa]AQX54728.1 DNA mismatch repair protein MutT [Priestia flexa]
MSNWKGAAAICINENNELLMVAQEKPNHPELWSVPSGGLEGGETFEECCVREVLEETGYEVEILGQVHEHDTVTYGVDVHIKYFAVQLVGGEKKLQDPDNLIVDVAWKPVAKMDDLFMLFEEERKILLRYIEDGVLKVN